MSENLFGWHDDPHEVEGIVSQLPSPLFAITAGDEIRDDSPRDVWHWDAEEFLFGETLKAHNQTIGDCVSHGGGRASQDLLFMDLMRRQLDPDDPASETSNKERAYQIVTEATYALSRIEIGNGRLGRGDGSIGAWAAKAANQYGVMSRRDYPEAGYDLTKYSGERAKKWGMPGAGLPNVLEPYAKEHPVKTVSLITSADDCRIAIQNRYPVAVCSQQGFKTQRRNDGTGICDPKGSWAHCMLFRGFMILRGNKHVLTLQQSWGNSPSGSREVNLESGETITLPEGCFNIEMSVADKMLSRNPDSFAYSGGTGFVRQAV